MGLSNYPPGVSGSEPEITGDWPPIHEWLEPDESGRERGICNCEHCLCLDARACVKHCECVDCHEEDEELDSCTNCGSTNLTITGNGLYTVCRNCWTVQEPEAE